MNRAEPKKKEVQRRRFRRIESKFREIGFAIEFGEKKNEGVAAGAVFCPPPSPTPLRPIFAVAPVPTHFSTALFLTREARLFIGLVSLRWTNLLDLLSFFPFRFGFVPSSLLLLLLLFCLYGALVCGSVSSVDVRTFHFVHCEIITRRREFGIDRRPVEGVLLLSTALPLPVQ